MEMLDAVGWAIRVARRLEAQHKRGAAHGGISPTAISIAGVSRTSKGRLATSSPRAATALSYRSPERLNSKSPSVVDDTWALAATLYTALTGEPPYGGANEPEIKQRIAAGRLKPLSEFDVGDDDLQRILQDALSREIATRTKTVAAFRRALEAWHPDPGAKNLLPIDDEESDEEEEFLAEERAEATVVRSVASDVLAKARRAHESSAPPPPGAATPVVPGSGDEGEVRVGAPRAPNLARLHADSDVPPDDAPTVMAEIPKAGRPPASGPQAGPPPAPRAPAPDLLEEQEPKPMQRRKKGMNPLVVLLLLVLLVGITYIITTQLKLAG